MNLSNKQKRERKLCFSKKVLTFKEACLYSGISESSMYKHTHNRTVPFYKPNGKLIYFKRSELENWMLQNRHSTVAELETEAVSKNLKADWRTRFNSKKLKL
ncbi:helix-turn-helix domain-containing protein [Psychroflexus sp. ALD_RP9]|uniref:helix-turn-helix domain-containing protein n=1 Tax=Psychroflexus sp. ALD_RP9 TaxID=2777186 RepID=UPI001A8CACBA|nr:helix-turn-helix domain-containing protein [Psychroflexus sp. ALD_RP9]QSS97818.1 helix-turn-helix domain-containing protein [Psychroflexus sp. ALD_RP9]